MLTVSIALFVLAALGGLVMAAQVFGNRMPSVAIAVVHGAVAATALVLALLAASAASAPPLLRYGAGILVVAALGGFFLLSFHVRGKPHPKAVVGLHALLAASGVVCLIAAAMH